MFKLYLIFAGGLIISIIIINYGQIHGETHIICHIWQRKPKIWYFNLATIRLAMCYFWTIQKQHMTDLNAFVQIVRLIFLLRHTFIRRRNFLTDTVITSICSFVSPVWYWYQIGNTTFPTDRACAVSGIDDVIVASRIWAWRNYVFTTRHIYVYYLIQQGVYRQFTREQ